jgi:ABC-2 type transport system permease protein
MNTVGVEGYRAGFTLTVSTEIRRQASRRRTQLALGFMVLLPLIILIAFQLNGGGSGEDDANGGGEFSALADLAEQGGPNFTLFTLLVSSGFLLTVVVALFCGDTIASEASWGSLRYLLAIPVPRARLLGVKLTVALLYSVFALVLLTGTALVAGLLRYGWAPMRPPIGGAIPPGESLVRLLAILGYLAVSLLVVDAWLGLLSDPLQTGGLVKGCISALVYAALFFGLAWWRFLRKDVVS